MKRLLSRGCHVDQSVNGRTTWEYFLFSAATLVTQFESDYDEDGDEHPNWGQSDHTQALRLFLGSGADANQGLALDGHEALCSALHFRLGLCIKISMHLQKPRITFYHHLLCSFILTLIVYGA